ncbi:MULTISPECIES: hypothetical protein [Alteromonas]|uniref:6-bladed beta-propeller n=1 Tax=Alteromonas stellipolaris TaxID=233316 RepID=A0AAW7Z0R3_9ALTE|nr:MULTISPECIES: hypothetical protein [Alteromonas]AMJ89558.1 hypothetical protein AV940_03165 [Alteromonas sp. Mac2]ALM91914.1 hypothetical protein AOR13_2910 [Alteromonas stellipolaris LMG 21856]AMJ73256.1 hypothetical protein AVL57_04250 [Alteromonas stellipolaris]AMJ85698.1 hypothetical protein AV939_03320 [Alteromonas sp. Mac1]ANB20079.1 hypothetical protein A6K25_01530 [Alteromonas stellipolaris]
MLGQNDWTYQIDEMWGEHNPAKPKPENAHALAFLDDRLLLVTDNLDHNVIEYDSNGKVIDAWGKQWPGAHGIKVVPDGDSTAIFIVDSGWVLNSKWDGTSYDKWDSPYNKMRQQAGSVAKLDKEGKVLFSIGHPQTVGAYRDDMPFNPTDMVVTDNGDFYIVDGYGSDYILHYDKHGRYLQKFGKENANSAENINNGHGITLDYRGETPLLLVSSRADHCLKWYTLYGEFIRTLHVPGAFIHAPLFNGKHMIAAVCWTGDTSAPELNSGVICIFDENETLVSVLGGELPEHGAPVRSDKKHFYHCHGLEQDKDGNLYLAQWKADAMHPIRLLKC